MSDTQASDSKIEDDKLVERVRNSDMSAFDRLVKKYEARIYNHCLKILRDKEDAEDALQETFLQVFRALGSFRGDSAFSTWLFKIATNCSLMKIRKRKNVNLVSIDRPIEIDGSPLQREIVDWSKNPSLIYGNTEIKKILDEIIARLPEDKRVVLILKDMEGFSNVEIAKTLGMKLAAVKSRLHRARLMAREGLNERFKNTVENSEGRAEDGL